MFKLIQLAMGDFRRARIHKSLSHFRQSAFTLLCSRLGRMALQAAHEVSGLELAQELTKEERRHIATAHLLTHIHACDIEVEDWIVKALIELALNEQERPEPALALGCYYH